MAADSRTPHTDALATLGTVIDEHEKRDAIHLGVDPTIAGENMKPGAHVYLFEGKAYHFKKGVTGVEPVGIVDPFLKRPVRAGERFWLIVYPRQITSLRHVWEHPAFPDSGETGGTQLLKPAATPEEIHQTKLLLGDPEAVAQDYIEKLANILSVGFDELIAATNNFLNYGEYFVDGGKFEGERIPDEYWKHFEIHTKTIVPKRDQYSFLSCSC